MIKSASSQRSKQMRTEESDEGVYTAAP